MSGAKHGYPQTGDVLEGRYRLDGELATGGMGKIMRARHLALDRDVAVKLLLPQNSQERDALLRFQREIKLVRQLNHPNTINVLDFGQTGTTMFFLVMELLEGEDLRTYIDRERPLELGDVGAIVVQMLDALSQAHAMEIVHRDIKPSNIFLITWGRHRNFVKVLDFGIAKSLKPDEQKLTQAGFVYGTSAYMAPERIAPQKFGTPGTSLDVYSIGLIFLEMMLGRRIFKTQNNPMNLLAQIETDVPVPPVFQGTPMEPVITRSLARFVPKRYPDAGAMLPEFEAALAHFDPQLKLSQRDVAVYFRLLSPEVGGSSNPFETGANFSSYPAVDDTEPDPFGAAAASRSSSGEREAAPAAESSGGASASDVVGPADRRATEVWQRVEAPQVQIGRAAETDETELVDEVPPEIEALREQYQQRIDPSARVDHQAATIMSSAVPAWEPQAGTPPRPSGPPEADPQPYSSATTPARTPSSDAHAATPSSGERPQVDAHAHQAGGDVAATSSGGHEPPLSPFQQRTANPGIRQTIPPTGDEHNALTLPSGEGEVEPKQDKTKVVIMFVAFMALMGLLGLAGLAFIAFMIFR